MMYWPRYLSLVLCGGLLLLVFLALIFAVVALVSRSRAGAATGWSGQPGRSRALEILQERYARGEITREQYEEMRRDLTT